MKALKILFVLISASAVLCSCGGESTPPELTVAQNIRHNSGTDFDVSLYCDTESYVEGDVKLSYYGEIDTETEGDYNIMITAKDKKGSKTSKETVVTVQKNRSKYSSDTVCKNIKEYIFNLQRNGYQNIGFLGYAEGFGFMAEAVTAKGDFEYNDYSGKLLFEAYQLESEKYSAFNMLFYIQQEVMWYTPKKVRLTAGSDYIDLQVMDEIQAEDKFGFYVTFDEFSEDDIREVPDYAYLEKLHRIAAYKGDVTMTAVGASDTFEMNLSDSQKKDFGDILMIYEEMLTYY